MPVPGPEGKPLKRLSKFPVAGVDRTFRAVAQFDVNDPTRTPPVHRSIAGNVDFGGEVLADEVIE